MKKILEFFIAYTFRIALWFRYDVKIQGAEHLNSKTLSKPGGVLFLSNHPTYFIDPMLVTLAVWSKYPTRPMIVEYMYYTPVINWVMRFMNAIPVPNFITSSNSLKRKRIESVVQTMIDDIKKGDNFLISPGGKVKHSAYEAIGGSSATHRILREAPEANVVLVRTKGLWGSSFSRALTGKAPDIVPTLTSAIKTIFKNLIFFTPRRKVIIEIEPAPADFPYQGSRLEVNRYLEKWYNRPDGLSQQKGEEPGDSLMLVSYSMWREKYIPLLSVEKPAEQNISTDGISAEIKEKVLQEIAKITESDPSKIKPDMVLATDLGMDSLDIAELVAFLQDDFDVKGVSPNDLTTVSKLMGYASKKIAVPEEAVEETIDLKSWFNPIEKKRTNVAPGETIPETFLNNCDRMGKRAACADLRSGVQTYPQFKIKVLVLAEYIRKLPGKYIGILLPASVGASVLIFACQLAGKIPLLINWTVGPRHLETVIKLSDVQVVLSSWAFIDKLNNVDLNGLEDKMVLLEDAAREFTLKSKLKALYRSKFSAKKILKIFGADKIKPDDTAVLLFTSGTESMPKGVPLSHHNILSNMRASLDSEEVYTDDVVYSFLPPFHSFGFSVCSVLGLIAGLRIAFFPDPTDGKRLAKGCERWKISIIVGAPTFIKGILKAATPEQIKTLRLCVTGAEKAPPELTKMMDQFGKGKNLIEGYGITECAPVLTLNPSDKPHKGVGMPVPGVELCIVHAETEELQPLNTQGLILARGPNIFKGYLNPGLASPFTTINGVEWYKTGDLGSLDENNYLTISGRLKRFIKLGGEMVSLASIEEALLHAAHEQGWQSPDEGPILAICAKELPGEKTKIYLFSRFDTTVEVINRLLRESGFSNLVKISMIKNLAQIPVMGTGKINYRILETEHLV